MPSRTVINHHATGIGVLRSPSPPRNNIQSPISNGHAIWRIHQRSIGLVTNRLACWRNANNTILSSGFPNLAIVIIYDFPFVRVRLDTPDWLGGPKTIVHDVILHAGLVYQ